MGVGWGEGENVMRALLLTILLMFPGYALAAEIHLAAAASLRELVVAAASRFEEQNPSHHVLVNTSSSGTLARQIEAGAPADIFLSANPQWMDYLVDKGKVSPESPVPWAANRLVVVGRGKVLNSLSDLKNVSRLAIASPESAPAGRYARTLLKKEGIYNDLLQASRLVFAKDVRQALLYAEQGVVEAAIIYNSDARLLQNAQIILSPANDQQPDILYPAALTRSGEASPVVLAFYQSLTGADGKELIATFGLIPMTGAE